MKWLLLALLSLPAAAQDQGAVKGPFQGHGHELFTLPSPRECGLVTRTAPNLLNPACLPVLQNAYLDQDQSILRRGGYSAYNLTACTGAQPIKGMWPFYATDGTLYLVAFSSNSMYYSPGDGTCSVLNPSAGGASWNLTASAEMQCAQGIGELVCTDFSDPVFETNIVSSRTIAGAPQGSLITFFRNRFWIAGVTGNLTQLYGSGQLNELDWVVSLYPSLSTSPVSIDISGANDGQKITCLLGPFQNQLYIGRNYDLFGLAGYDNRDFTLRKVSEQVGCIEPKSGQEVNNVLYWVSKRGVEGLTGTQILPVSYPIDPTIQKVIAATGNTRSRLLSTQSDWVSGNLTASGPGAPLSATLSPGDVVPSSFTAATVSTTSFAVGVSSGAGLFLSGTGLMPGAVNYSADVQYVASVLPQSAAPAWTSLTVGGICVSESVSGGTVTYTIANTAAGNPCGAGVIAGATLTPATLSTTTTNTLITVYAAGASNGPPVATTPKFALVFAQGTPVVNGTSDIVAVRIGTATVQYYALGNNTTDEAYTAGTFSTFTVLITTYSVARFWRDGVFKSAQNIGQAGAITTIGMLTERINFNTGGFIGYVATYTFTTGVTDPGNVDLPLVSTYTSTIFDTSFTTTTGGLFTATTTLSALGVTTVTYQVRDSAVGTDTGWSAWQNVADQYRVPLVRRYWQYRALMQRDPNLFAAPEVLGVSLEASTTGYYIGPCVQVSTPVSWGRLDVDAVLNGGSFTFYTSTGGSCGAAIASTATWNAQSPNAQISVSTNTTYIATRVLFSMDAGTQTPTLSDITYNWNTGSNRPPVASAEYLDRYYLFYTTNTFSAATNDHALVYDYNKTWTLLDDVYAYSATKYLNQLFLGDSQSTGKIYQAETGTSDNGGAFTYSFQTADLDLGEPAQRKDFKWAYLLVDGPQNSAQNISIACSYAIDGSTTSYSLGSTNLGEAPEQSGYYVAKFPFPASSPTSAHWLNVSCSYSGTDGPVRVYGLKLVYGRDAWE